MAANYPGAMEALREFILRGLLEGNLQGVAYYGKPNEKFAIEFTPSAKATEDDIKRIKETLESFDVPVEQK